MGGAAKAPIHICWQRRIFKISVGNDFTRQGIIAAKRLVGLIGESGKVAVMQGFPTAPNHKERYEAQIAGPIGIAEAIKDAKRVGKVKVVAMDGIKPILEAIKAGILESSSSTIPKMQGSMSILMLWQACLGVQLPRKIDTGIDVITRENVDDFLSSS